MADAKISALTNLTAADAINDMIPIVDVSDTPPASGNTKRISINNLLSSSPTASGALTVTGLVTAGSATITGDLTVDTSTLKVDSTNNRVGIGTASPATDLHVFKSSATDNALIQLQNGTASSYIGTRGTTYGAVDAGDTYVFNSSGNDIVLMADNAAGTIKFAAGGNAESMRLNTAGNLAFVSGKGIDFSAVTGGTGTATGNVLNDYEEGTWTIGLTFGGASVGLTTALNTGRYTKIGRQVTVCGRLELSNKGSSTGAAVITGLPFTVASGNDSQQAASFRFNGVSYTGSFQGYGGVSSTSINLEQISEAGSPTEITNSNFNNGTSIQISLTYTV
jgi:hypothetical protein